MVPLRPQDFSLDLRDGIEGSGRRTELTLVMLTTTLVRTNLVKTQGLPHGALIP